MNALARQIADHLQTHPSQRYTVAVAESLTGGLVQAVLTSISGASSWFRGGVVAYNIDAKAEILGVDYSYAKSCNCVSERTALEMAQGVAQKFHASFGLATTGYAEPDPTHGAKWPHAHIAVYSRDVFSLALGTAVTRFVLGGVDCSRTEMQQLVARELLKLFLETLGDLRKDGHDDP